MPKSTKQLQDDVLGFLDNIGANQDEFKRATSGYKGLEYFLILSATNFILKVQDNLNKQGKIDTGNLSKELEQSAVVTDGNNLSIKIGYPSESDAAKYYDYVNKGVKGYVSNQPNSPYTFKKARPLPSKGMVLNIAKWLRRNASFGRREDSKAIITQGQRKRKSLSKMVDENKRFKSLAFAVAKSIKMKGIKKSGYFDDAVQTYFGADFSKRVSKIVGREIVINVKAIQPNGNNNQ